VVGTHLLTPEKEHIALGYSTSMRMALRLMGVALVVKDDVMLWMLTSDWRARLRWAGLDPDTRELVDARRWALAWRQLINNGRFDVETQKRAIERGDSAPEPADYVLRLGNSIRPRKKEKKAEPPVQREEEEETFDHVISRSIRKRISNR
jgi:hypothetical protein